MVVVTVLEAYLHCSKALHRAALWSTDTWLSGADLPSAAGIFRDHAAMDVDVDTIDAALERDRRDTLWQPGGAHPG